MKHSESITKLAAALCKAQAEVGNPKKSGYNKFDKYPYALLEDIISACRPVLNKFGLSVMQIGADVVSASQRTTSKGGTEHHFVIREVYSLLHESGEWVEFEQVAEGQDRADKAIYKAATGGRKYALMALLNLASEDDPERDESVGNSNGERRPAEPRRPTPKPEPEPSAGGKPSPSRIAAAQIQEAIERWIPHNPEDWPAIKEQVKAAYGLPDKPTSADLTGLYKWIEGNIERRVPFADAAKERSQ